MTYSYIYPAKTFLIGCACTWSAAAPALINKEQYECRCEESKTKIQFDALSKLVAPNSSTTTAWAHQLKSPN